MLTLTQLKQAAYQSWETLYYVQGLYSAVPLSADLPQAEAERLPFTNPTFKSEVRQRFGDLRRRSTWEQAAVWMAAQLMAQSYLEPYQIVGYMVSATYMNDPIRQHYGESVVEAMLQFPEVIAIVKAGLEQVYHSNEYPQERSLVEQYLKAGHQLPFVLAQLVAA
jgi:hypothetical protein